MKNLIQTPLHDLVHEYFLYMFHRQCRVCHQLSCGSTLKGSLKRHRQCHSTISNTLLISIHFWKFMDGLMIRTAQNLQRLLHQ